MHHEHSLVAFLKRNKRERYREILADAHLRHKFTGKLAHFADFDPAYRIEIPGKVETIARELLKRHSPAIVFAISEDPALDRRDLPLVEALGKVVGCGMGTILSCLPGQLVFVETEDERFILERHDTPQRHQYIRFVIGRKDEDSHVEQGIFQAASEARDRGHIAASDLDELYDVRAWFNDNLDEPSSFKRNSLPLGICWFKTGAAEHIARIWQMVKVLERNGVYVKKIRTGKPGYLIYEDEWQIVAEPFRKGTMPRKR